MYKSAVITGLNKIEAIKENKKIRIKKSFIIFDFIVFNSVLVLQTYKKNTYQQTLTSVFFKVISKVLVYRAFNSSIISSFFMLINFVYNSFNSLSSLKDSFNVSYCFICL